jgi:hypothetical protein
MQVGYVAVRPNGAVSSMIRLKRSPSATDCGVHQDSTIPSLLNIYNFSDGQFVVFAKMLQ